MRLLVLGGTAFVGHAVVAIALARRWEVTTFNRGCSGQDIAGVQAIRGDRNNAKDLTSLAKSGPWNAVVDTSGYVPCNTLDVAQALEPVVDRYVFMSTVSVYRDWPIKPLSETSEILYCPPDAESEYGEDVEDGPTRYGYQKSGCEAAALATFGAERTTLLRPGVVLGPREYIGRLPWWLHRVALGGRMLAPGSPERSIQPVDVRDLAAFTLHNIEHGASGAYNVAAPIGRETFGGMLNSCAKVTESDAEFVWVPDEQLLAHGVRQWSEMPLWRTFPGVWGVDSTKAHEAGLVCRPLAETVADTWSWLSERDGVNNHESAVEIGISPKREQEILRLIS